jgi:ribosomal protein L14
MSIYMRIDVRRADGRYIRFSHTRNVWQVNRKTPTGMQWFNISTNLARVYAAAGLPVGVQT